MSIDPGSITFGLDTFGDVTVEDDGSPKTGAQVIRDLVEAQAERLRT